MHLYDVRSDARLILPIISPRCRQSIAILVIQPLTMLVMLVLAFVVWPPIAPYVVWLPYVGGALGGAAAKNAFSGGSSGVLTRHIEHVSDRFDDAGC